MPLDVLIPLVYAMDYEMTAKPVDFCTPQRRCILQHPLGIRVERSSNQLHGCETRLEQRRTNEIHSRTRKALRDAVIPVDQQEHAAALA